MFEESISSYFREILEEIEYHIAKTYLPLIFKITNCILCMFQDDDPEAPKNSIQNARELRFLNFASVEYEGSIYMTPQDFLESVTKDNPRRKYLIKSYFKISLIV